MSVFTFFAFSTQSCLQPSIFFYLDAAGVGRDVEEGSEVSSSDCKRKETQSNPGLEWTWEHLSDCDERPSERGDIDNRQGKLGTKRFWHFWVGGGDTKCKLPFPLRLPCYLAILEKKKKERNCIVTHEMATKDRNWPNI